MTTTERIPLTNQQQQVYAFIVDWIGEHGYSPTVRDICKAFGFKSPNGAMAHLRPMRRKGWIVWVDGICRTIRPLEVQP